MRFGPDRWSPTTQQRKPDPVTHDLLLPRLMSGEIAV